MRGSTVLNRDVAKISNRCDYVDGGRVLWVTLKRKSYRNMFVSREVEAYSCVFYLASGYYLHP